MYAAVAIVTFMREINTHNYLAHLTVSLALSSKGLKSESKSDLVAYLIVLISNEGIKSCLRAFLKKQSRALDVPKFVTGFTPHSLGYAKFGRKGSMNYPRPLTPWTIVFLALRCRGMASIHNSAVAGSHRKNEKMKTQPPRSACNRWPWKSCIEPSDKESRPIG